MRIKDRLEYKTKSPVLSFVPEDTVHKASQVMSEKGFGSCAIIDKKEVLVGIVTERDFMCKVVSKALDPKKTKLKDIMTTDLKVAHPEDDLLDWMRQMSNERFRHLPIVDEEGKIVNMMSQGDFVSYTWPELINRVKEATKASITSGYPVVIIVVACLFYSLVVMSIIGVF